MNRVLWSAPIDLVQNATSTHYGAPLITASNTVIVPMFSSFISYSLKAYEGWTGRLKYTLTNDFRILGTTGGSRPVYQSVLAGSASGLRLYYPGAGGTVYYVENPDSDTPGPPVQICFYTNLAGYASNAAAFNSALFINTPLTASTNGDIYFAYRGSIPSINTNGGGFVRIDANGKGTYAAPGGSTLNCAPALSNDGSTIYFANSGTLLGLDSQTLATKYIGSLSFYGPDDSKTSSPTVGPDGDVYLGGSWLFHFSCDLATRKLNGVFGWDYTDAAVLSTIVPSYSGPSSYLLFSKYNDYGSRNRIAVLDPNVRQYSANFGGTAMREVLTALSPTPYGNFGQTEWCINTAAVNPIDSCVFAPNEDGRLYRWDLAANCLSETIALNGGVGEPYVPTCIGPDGAIYTINGATLYAIGQLTNLDVTISSSVPDLTRVVALQPLTFTATVTNLNPSDPVPTGTVTFQDITYTPSIRVTNFLAADVVLSNYTASVTVSTLSSNTGNHFVTAIYSGDSNYPSTSITMVQKVHAQASVTQITSSIPYPGSNQVTFLATVTPGAPPGPATSGMVSIWDGTNFLAQQELNSGKISVTITNFAPRPHAVVARYYSDANYAASSGAVIGVPATLNQMQVTGDGTFVIGFTNVSGAPFTVLSSTDLLAPLSGWTVLGQANEVLPGQFQYSDAQALNRDAVRFYRLRSP
jgi:hypothetical protein